MCRPSDERQHAVGLSTGGIVACGCGRLDRAPSALGRAALIAEARVHVRQPERVAGRECNIVQSRDARLVWQQHVDALAPSAQKVERVCLLLRDLHHPSIAIRPFRQPLQPARGHIQMQHGFRIRVHARGTFGGAREPCDGLVYQIGAGVVIRERRRQFVHSIAIQRFEGSSRAKMELAAAAGEQTVVGHVLSQRVLEHVRRLFAPGTFEEELEAAQLGELVRDGCARAPTPSAAPASRSPADDRSAP